MPLHVQLDLPPARALNIDDYEPSFAAYMRTAWGDADNDNPGTVTGNMLEASERRYGFNVMDVAETGGLTVGQMASTRMFCPGLDQEQAFSDVLSGATHYEVDGDMLMLLTDGELRAVLQAR